MGFGRPLSFETSLQWSFEVLHNLEPSYGLTSETEGGGGGLGPIYQDMFAL